MILHSDRQPREPFLRLSVAECKLTDQSPHTTIYFKTVTTRSVMPICAQPSLSEASPALPLETVPLLVRHSIRKSSATHSYQCVQYFPCVQTSLVHRAHFLRGTLLKLATTLLHQSTREDKHRQPHHHWNPSTSTLDNPCE